MKEIIHVRPFVDFWFGELLIWWDSDRNVSRRPSSLEEHSEPLKEGEMGVFVLQRHEIALQDPAQYAKGLAILMVFRIGFHLSGEGGSGFLIARRPDGTACLC
jgi:hypothetical protein